MGEHDELTSARREILVAIIAEQRAVIAQDQATIVTQATRIAELDRIIADLQKRITALEHRLSGRGGPGMPGNKPASATPPRPATPRKKRARGYGRARLLPTETVAHAVEACPDCGTRLVGGWIQRTREVIELPVAPVRVIAHQYLARECPQCGKRSVPAVALDGVVLGPHHRLGIGLVSLIVTLREEGRLPFGTIQWFLATVHQVHLSEGELVRIIQQVAARAADTVAAIRTAIQQSPVVHADETGWREHGVNGYVWTWCTQTDQYLVRRGRGKEVVDEVLGPDFSGTLVSDFYASYHHYPGVHQRCWAHLLRDIHDLTEAYPTDTGLADWAAVVRALYREAVAFHRPEEPARRAKQRELEERLLACCRPFLTDSRAVQAKLCRRIERLVLSRVEGHLSELFVFVADPRVPATNNVAERSLRHLVTTCAEPSRSSRKISGGTQSHKGTTGKMTLASLFGTWRTRGLNPLHACQSLLQPPHQ